MNYSIKYPKNKGVRYKESTGCFIKFIGFGFILSFLVFLPLIYVLLSDPNASNTDDDGFYFLLSTGGLLFLLSLVGVNMILNKTGFNYFENQLTIWEKKTLFLKKNKYSLNDFEQILLTSRKEKETQSTSASSFDSKIEIWVTYFVISLKKGDNQVEVCSISDIHHNLSKNEARRKALEIIEVLNADAHLAFEDTTEDEVSSE